MTDFIHMTANSSGRVDITLDLSAYIEAFETAGRVTFKNVSEDIHAQLTGIPGQMHWEEALSLATQHLTPEQHDAIENSPAAKMMNNSFIEIIKNSMDESIAKYYDSNRREKPRIQLALDLDTSNPKQISIQITDSGRGFPSSFLDNVSTQKNRDTYVNTSRGSDKEKKRDRPPLFGGQGRGLRILIAEEEGDVLERSGKRTRRFTKPEISSVEFNNVTDQYGRVQGAQITVTTSLEPREMLSWKANKIKQQLQQEMRENATPSPTDSIATTHESIGSSRGPTPMLDLEFLDDYDQMQGDDFEEDDFEEDNNKSPKI
ncbi:MAG: hypothetical protein P1U39_07645 [Legionellaceae bacterium]|nr:hypothetical protein [Legionellaceae bacterium]